MARKMFKLGSREGRGGNNVESVGGRERAAKLSDAVPPLRLYSLFAIALLLLWCQGRGFLGGVYS